MRRLFEMLGSRISSGLDVNVTEMKGLARRFHEDEEGQGMTEYIIILVLIAIFVIIVVKVFGEKIKGLFKDSTNAINDNVNATPTE